MSRVRTPTRSVGLRAYVLPSTSRFPSETVERGGQRYRCPFDVNHGRHEMDFDLTPMFRRPSQPTFLEFGVRAEVVGGGVGVASVYPDLMFGKCGRLSIDDIVGRFASGHRYHRSPQPHPPPFPRPRRALFQVKSMRPQNLP